MQRTLWIFILVASIHEGVDTSTPNETENFREPLSAVADQLLRDVTKSQEAVQSTIENKRNGADDQS
jgi:hypothetical protein